MCGDDGTVGVGDGLDDGSVGDRENRMFWFGAGCDFDSAAGEVVPSRVREKVGGESLDEVGVAGRPGGLERQDAFELAEVMST